MRKTSTSIHTPDANHYLPCVNCEHQLNIYCFGSSLGVLVCSPTRLISFVLFRKFSFNFNSEVEKHARLVKSPSIQNISKQSNWMYTVYRKHSLTLANMFMVHDEAQCHACHFEHCNPFDLDIVINIYFYLPLHSMWTSFSGIEKPKYTTVVNKRWKKK